MQGTPVEWRTATSIYRSLAMHIHGKIAIALFMLVVFLFGTWWGVMDYGPINPAAGLR